MGPRNTVASICLKVMRTSRFIPWFSACLRSAVMTAITMFVTTIAAVGIHCSMHPALHILGMFPIAALLSHT